MIRKQFRFLRECEYCGEKYQPNGKRNFSCKYCSSKSYEFGRMKRALVSFKRMLLVLKKDKDKTWYDRFRNVIREFEKVVVDISKEMKKK